MEYFYLIILIVIPILLVRFVARGRAHARKPTDVGEANIYYAVHGKRLKGWQPGTIRVRNGEFSLLDVNRTEVIRVPTSSVKAEHSAYTKGQPWEINSTEAPDRKITMQTAEYIAWMPNKARAKNLQLYQMFTDGGMQVAGYNTDLDPDGYRELRLTVAIIVVGLVVGTLLVVLLEQ